MRDDCITLSLPDKSTDKGIFIQDSFDMAATLFIHETDMMMELAGKGLSFSLTRVGSLAKESIEAIEGILEAVGQASLGTILWEMGEELVKPFRTESPGQRYIVGKLGLADPEESREEESAECLFFSLLSDICIPVQTLAVSVAKVAFKLGDNKEIVERLGPISRGNKVWKKGAATAEQYQQLEPGASSKKLQKNVAALISSFSGLTIASVGFAASYIEVGYLLPLLPLLESTYLTAKIWAEVADEGIELDGNKPYISPLEWQARGALLSNA